MPEELLVAGFDQVDAIVKALNSPLRRSILALVYRNPLNINQIAAALKVHQSTCTVNVQALEEVGLVQSSITAGPVKGAQKLCSTDLTEIVIPLHKTENPEENGIITTEMPIGLYTAYECHPPCGLVSEREIIGLFDVCDSFSYPQRAAAQLIWIAGGYMEYGFPKRVPPETRVRSVSFRAELCSEYPGHNAEWPSDITVWINGAEVGTWRAPGDMGGAQRGKLTPTWWLPADTQYGFKKQWTVSGTGSFVDGQRVSDTTLDDLRIDESPRFVVRVGIKEDAECPGGLNLFGAKFGNYPNDLMLTVEVSRDDD